MLGKLPCTLGPRTLRLGCDLLLLAFTAPERCATNRRSVMERGAQRSMQRTGSCWCFAAPMLWNCPVDCPVAAQASDEGEDSSPGAQKMNHARLKAGRLRGSCGAACRRKETKSELPIIFVHFESVAFCLSFCNCSLLKRCFVIWNGLVEFWRFIIENLAGLCFPGTPETASQQTNAWSASPN